VITIAKYKIEHDLKGCIACGACAAVSDNWYMTEVDGEEKALSKVEEFDESDLEHNKEAAESCPVEVIHIINKETGDKVF